MRSDIEKRRILESCHSEIEGRYVRINFIICQCPMDWTVGCRLGRGKTIEKVASSNINEEIRKFDKHCEQCQKMNATFPISNSKLHPIVPVPNVHVSWSLFIKEH